MFQALQIKVIPHDGNAKEKQGFQMASKPVSTTAGISTSEDNAGQATQFSQRIVDRKSQ